VSFGDAKAAVAGGLSIVCATCENYWGARERGVPDGKCLATDGCGSPIAGDVFHEYLGPMTQFDQFCFRCGDKATHALRVDKYVRVIGVCRDHVDMVKKLKPQGKRATSVVILSKEGESSTADEAVPEKPVIRFRGGNG
jgi:hypothetical protein